VKDIYIISHTHWDREWYLPFQLFRRRLVQLMDRLLDLLETNPDYRYFHLDGQTVVIEDYLEVRPEQESRLRRHLQSGRLLAGPWYVLPDEFLVSGEALIRNLLLGHRLAAHFGGEGAVMKVGYIPDPFGQISQLPQILAGFGIDNAIFWRGVGHEATTSEFWWQAPDGSRSLVAHLPFGYCNAQTPGTEKDAFRQRIEDLRARLEPLATTDALLAMNGCDHLEPEPTLPAMIAAYNATSQDVRLHHACLPDYIAHLRRMAAGPTGSHWPVLHGEFRHCQRAQLLPNVLSTRIWIKQRNAALETLLERWAEPTAALASLVNAEAAATAGATADLLWCAWKYLLQNQPHDSICGCSVDQVHREMVTRYDWGEQIAGQITEENLRRLAEAVNSAAVVPAGSWGLVVFNPTATPRDDLVTTSLTFPGSLESFVITEPDGTPLPHQILSQERQEIATFNLTPEEMRNLLMDATTDGWVRGLAVREGVVHTKGTTCYVDVTVAQRGNPDPPAIAHLAQVLTEQLEAGHCQRFVVHAHFPTTCQVLLAAKGIPGFGYRTYVVRPASGGVQSNLPDTPANGIENEFFRVEADPADGTLTVTDKSTGRVWPGLNRLVDGGDGGDEYNYSAPPADRLVYRPAAPPRIERCENGPARFTLRIEMVYHLPARLTPDRQGRSEQTVDCPVSCQVRLGAGVRRIDIHTEFDNRAEDHRLRAHFPTGIVTPVSRAEATFDVVTRPVIVPAGNPDWPEQPVGTYPQKGFVSVGNDDAGLVIANRGLPEFEITNATTPGEYRAMTPETPATIALTLLRSVGWLSRDDFAARRGNAGPGIATPEAQCLGRQQFDYAIIPYSRPKGAGQHPEEAAWLSADAFVAPLQAVDVQPGAGSLPPAASFIRLTPASLVLSSLKLAEKDGGVVLRFWNRGDTPVTGTVTFWRPVRAAWRANLAEEKGEGLTIGPDNTLHLPVKQKEMITLLIDLEPSCSIYHIP